MFLTALSLFYLVSLAVGQTDVAQCALSCVANVYDTGCNQSQFSCLCQSQTWLQNTSSCAKSSCSTADYDLAISAIKQLCAIFQASLTVAPYATASTLPSDAIFSTVAVPIPSSLPPVVSSSNANNTMLVTESNSPVATISSVSLDTGSLNPATTATRASSGGASTTPVSSNTPAATSTNGAIHSYAGIHIKAVVGFLAVAWLLN